MKNKNKIGVGMDPISVQKQKINSKNNGIAMHNSPIHGKNSKRGITLVSLVITIIVLLLLAAIAIHTLLGDNGIIKKAEEAGAKYKNSAMNEQEQLNTIEDFLGEMGIPTGDVEFTIEPATSRNTLQTGKQNEIEAGPIKIIIEYKKEKGLVREYAIQKIGQTGDIVWKTASTNPVVIEVTENVTILTRYRNIEQNTSQTIPLNIMNVDNIAPDAYSYEVENTTTNSITVKAETQDTADEGAGTNIAGIGKYQYSKDNGVTWEEDATNPSNTSYTFTNLTQNQGYKIAVKAIDKAGNERVATNNGTTITTSEIAGGNEDNTGLITISPSIANWTNQDIAITVNWPSNTAGLTKEISVDTGSTWKIYTATETINQNTTIMGRLKDSTGQTSNKTAVLNITNIDKLKPNAFSFTTSTTTNSITVTGNTTDQAKTDTNGASGIKGYQYSINNGEWTAITTNTTNTFENLTQGQSYVIKMKAIDNAGNEIEASNTGSTVTVGSIPGGDGGNAGLITITPSTANWTNQNITVSVNWPSNVTGLTKEISLNNGGTWKTYTTAETITANTVVLARLKDSTGQLSPKTALLNITNIDKTAPNKVSVNLNGYGSGNWTNGNVTQTYNSGDSQSGINRYQYTTDGGANWYDCPNPWVINWDGQWNFYVRAIDNAGNIGPNSDMYTIRRDTVGPTITAVNTGNKTDSTITVTITGAYDTGWGSIAGYQYYINGWGGTEGGSKTFTGLTSNTTYYIYIRAVDSLGNIGAQVGPYAVKTDGLPQTGDTNPYLPDNNFTQLPGTDLGNGLVVTNGTDQYVWIEVPKSITASASTTAQIESALQNYAAAYRQSGYMDRWYSGCGIGSQGEYDALKNKMLNSIKTYGGFWIGRYEAGTADNSIRTSNIAITANSVFAQDRYPYNYITESQAQELAARNSTSNYTSSLLFGIQWDLTCKYLETKGIGQDIITSYSIPIGNYYSANFTVTRGKYSTNRGTNYSNVYGSYNKVSNVEILLTTGASERNKTMNIYDLAGNQWEWSLENSNISYRPAVRRGGSYYWEGGAPLSARYGNDTGYVFYDFAFRSTLYK